MHAAFERLERMPAAERPQELCVSARLPEPTAEPFALGQGFEHDRLFRTMERGLGAPPTPEWPAGLELRVHDGSERMLEELTAAYNAAFAEHAMTPTATVEQTREITRQSHFRPDGLLLAYRPGAAWDSVAMPSTPITASSTSSASLRRRAASGSAARWCDGVAAGSRSAAFRA